LKAVERPPECRCSGAPDRAGRLPAACAVAAGARATSARPTASKRRGHKDRALVTSGRARVRRDAVRAIDIAVPSPSAVPSAVSQQRTEWHPTTARPARGRRPARAAKVSRRCRLRSAHLIGTEEGLPRNRGAWSA